jgi:hypothetical protein
VSVTPEQRALIVSGLSGALVTAWRRSYGDEKHERPAPEQKATGRIVRGEGGREHVDSTQH